MSNFHPMGSAFSAQMESNSKAVKIELCRAMRRAKEENERRLAAKAAKEAEDTLRKEREMAVIEIDAGLATVLSRSLGTPKALLSALSKAQALVAGLACIQAAQTGFIHQLGHRADPIPDSVLGWLLRLVGSSMSVLEICID